MNLIGLAGPPGVGKNTIGDYLRERRGYIRAWRTVPSANVRGQLDRPIVVIDLLHNFEAYALRAAGGQIWLVQRPGYLVRAGALYQGITPDAADRGLLNDGPIAALYNRVEKLLIDLQDAQG